MGGPATLLPDFHLVSSQTRALISGAFTAPNTLEGVGPHVCCLMLIWWSWLDLAASPRCVGAHRGMLDGLSGVPLEPSVTEHLKASCYQLWCAKWSRRQAPGLSLWKLALPPSSTYAGKCLKARQTKFLFPDQ